MGLNSESGSDSEGRRERDRDSGEIGWRYATAPDGNKSKPQCNFCGKRLGGGGITRLKHHLVGDNRNVAKCLVCPKDVRELVKANFAGKKEKDQIRARRDEEFNEFMFEKEFNVLSDSDDDEDFVYPFDIQTPAERRAYRLATKESMRDEAERRQLRAGLGLARGAAGAGGSGSGSGVPPPSKKQKGKGLEPFLTRTGSMDYRPSKDPRQKTVKGLFTNARERVGKAISKLFFAQSIPANVANGPFLQHAIDEIAAAGTGVKAPTSYELMNKYLTMEKNEMTEYINELKKKWPEFGVTLMCDGWTSYTRKQIINFLVYCDGKTIFLKSVDASDQVKDHKYLLELLKGVIKEVGKENIVQIVTDNGSNFKKAGEMIQANTSYGIFWTPCAAHCIDLILKDFGKKKSVLKVVEDARAITTFIYNHSKILALMRRMCNGELVRPGITRFATNFIALQSLKQQKTGLKTMCCQGEWFEIPEARTEAGRKVETLINDLRFWDNVTAVTKVMEPVVSALRIVDGDKKPTMGVIYEAMRCMREKVQQAVGNRRAKTWVEIIDERWTKMLSHPLHKAAYYLNPKYQYKKGNGTNAELLAALQIVVEKLVKDDKVQTSCMNEVKYFRDALGSFGRATAINGRGNTLPAEWWLLYGMDAPHLRMVAIKVLSQTASAGGCERNWSTFNLIHSKRRNRLGERKLHDLVYVHYNLRLKMKHAREGNDKDDYTDPIDLAYIFKMHDDDAEDDVLQQWMDTNGAPVLDEAGGRPNQNISQQMGADVGDYLARSGRLTDPLGSLEVDAAIVDDILSSRSNSRSKSKSKSKDDSGGDDDDDLLADIGGGGGEPEEVVSGRAQDRRFNERVQAGNDYLDQRRNAHGQLLPSPRRGNADPMDYEAYQRGFGSGSYMEDLISSVGSLSMDVDSPYRPREASSSSPVGGYRSHDETSFGPGMIPEYFHAPPPPPPPQVQSQAPSGPYGYGYYDSYSSENYVSGQPSYPDPDQSQSSFFGSGGYGFFPDYYTAGPPPERRSSPTPSSSSRTRGSQAGSSRPRRARDASFTDAYPRIGILMTVNDHEYRQYVMDYKAMYSYMTWENYCEYIESAMRYERQHERHGDMDPARNSWF